MTTTLEHLKSDKMPASAKFPVGLPVTPTMQAVIVDCVPVVNPQLAAIIRNDAEPVVASLEDSHAGCPTHCEVIATSKTRPSATCVAIVHCLAPACHVRAATAKILTTTALTEVEDVLPEDAATISGWRSSTASACTHNKPSASSVETLVPEQHPCMTATLKHLKFYTMPTRAEMPVGLAIAPAMQAIIVDCVSIVNPQLASIIRDDAKSVMARPENSQAACPTHSKVVTS
jgi:hypothetical protein